MTAGIASVAAPVYDHGGRPVAAVGLTFAADAHPDLASRAVLAAEVVATAGALTRRLSR